MAIFGFLLSALLYYSELTKARALIGRTSHGVALFIDGYFTEIINTIEVLEENKEIRDAMALGNDARERILDGYRSITKANKNIAYIYSGYENGLMLINDWTPPDGFIPSTRPWYRAAIADKNGTSIGLPYQEVKTKEWLVSTSRALKQSGGGYGGVVAIDCSIDQIIKFIAHHDEYKTEISFVVDRNGIVIIHPDQSILGTSLPELTKISTQKSEGVLPYRSGNVDYFAHYSRIASTGWTILTVVEKKEILRPIIVEVLSLVGLTGVIALLLSFVQSILLSRRLSRPLVELGKKIKATIAGDEQNGAEYTYPDNEIGLMAREIGQLAAKELTAKANELQVSEEIYKSILMASPDDITIADLSGNVIMVSEAANRIFGYEISEGPGMSVMDFIVPEDHERARANMAKMIYENHHGPNEYRAVRKDGSCFDIEVNNSLVRDRQGNPVQMVLIARDITNRKKNEQQIQVLFHQLEIERDLAQRNSLTDSLTGLSNRRLFDTMLQTEFSRHKRTGTHLSLIMIDVDHFKNYNDYYGHLAGDDCLRQIARTLKVVVERGTDSVARFGGEEFVVILPDTNRRGAAVLAEQIAESVRALALPHAASDTAGYVTISLGVASAADHALTDGSQLVDLADQAMYQAKNSGRNRCVVLTSAE
ncbi:MAG: diguanylate cyclase [Desulfuromonadaceae bacterium]|nr:diguanylate cyclase [Desulfuromonadaceae bacterium]